MKSVAVYFVGALIYASQVSPLLPCHPSRLDTHPEKVPERWLHGWFDYIGGSHNIWHCAVLGGILFHYRAMQSIFSIAFERALQEC